MSNNNLLCKNLSLSAWLDSGPGLDTIKIRLVDKLALKKKEVEITVEPGTSGPQASRSYRVQEAIVIAMRRLVSEAIKEGLISVTPGTSATSPPAIRHGGIKDIILEIPPDL